MKARIEGIGTYRLILDGYYLDLEKCLYVLKCARHLVSIAKLDKSGFKSEIGNNVFSLCKNKYYYGSGALIEDLYRSNLDVMFAESLFNIEQSIGKKCSAYNENSAFLWHKRLSHISKERGMRLIRNDILPQLDFTDWDICVDCIKGKQTSHISKYPATSTEFYS